MHWAPLLLHFNGCSNRVSPFFFLNSSKWQFVLIQQQHKTNKGLSPFMWSTCFVLFILFSLLFLHPSLSLTLLLTHLQTFLHLMDINRNLCTEIIPLNKFQFGYNEWMSANGKPLTKPKTYFYCYICSSSFNYT